MKRNLEVRWKRSTAAGYTDVFALEGFAKQVADADRRHLVRGPHGGRYHDFC